ncbi:MAG TPA: IPT/TIG domain-containing protein, partial [Burkholderiaceae bacterium]|nr:IPT/TIG domain-containing protein [Burkholderiaceae bacterium]
MNRRTLSSPTVRSTGSRLLLGLAAALSALMLTACGGGGGGSAPPAPAVQQPTPAVSGIAPTTVVAGSDVTLTGTNLDQLRSATLNGVALTLRSQSATSAVLTIPANATSGFITITDSNRSSAVLSQQLNVLVRIAVTGFTPARALAGGSVTINGSGFARVREVRFTGAAAAAPITTRSDTQLVVTVPADAATGLITLVGETANDPNPTASNFELVPPVLVNASAVYAPTAGASFSITGTGLSEVTGASIAGVPATITNASATSITLQPGAGAPCGAIVLVARLQPTVVGGTLATANQCDANVRLAEIDVAQVYSQTPGDPYQRLVPGKETWIRAFVVSTAANRAAPTVRVTGLQGTTALGTVNLTGPATLPQVAAGAAIPSTVQYDLAQTFAAELPAAWIAPNLTLRVEVDPERRNNA